jgi:hypothetical protein
VANTLGVRQPDPVGARIAVGVAHDRRDDPRRPRIRAFPAARSRDAARLHVLEVDDDGAVVAGEPSSSDRVVDRCGAAGRGDQRDDSDDQAQSRAAARAYVPAWLLVRVPFVQVCLLFGGVLARGRRDR